MKFKTLIVGLALTTIAGAANAAGNVGRAGTALPRAQARTTVRPWGMVEVFLLGTLVSLAKLAHLASLVPGIALWSFAVLMVLLAAAASSFDPPAAAGLLTQTATIVDRSFGGRGY